MEWFGLDQKTMIMKHHFKYEEWEDGVTTLVSDTKVLKSFPETDLVGRIAFGHFTSMVTETHFFPYPDKENLSNEVIELVKCRCPKTELQSDDGLEYVKTRCDYLRILFLLGECGELPDYIPLDIPNNLNQKYAEMLKKDYEEDYKRCLMLCE